MTSKSNHEIQTIFEAVCRLSASERTTWYTQNDTADTVRQEVEELLRYDSLAQAEEFFTPRTATGERDVLIGTSVGPYEVISLIGRGGMGSVYHARRRVPYEQDVAIKVADLRLGSGTVRFHEERQVLADLQHPGIAKLLDGGILHDDRPYLVMEHVPGEHIDVYADSHKLRVMERVQLWLQVCEAVASAHQRGIIHRDLKPSNILVTQDRRVVVVDFGLARRWEQQSGLTRTAMVLGTPDYMAPEQALGKKGETTPATDVYALGAVLYTLLTGRPPFRSESPLQLVTLMLQEEPVSPRRLNPAVPRDLETICLKCLEKEPGKRYTSAGELAADVQRLQRGELIRARSLGMVGRGYRWARRRPMLAAMIGLFVITIMTSLVIVTNYWRRANAALELAKESSRQLFEHATELKDLPGMQRPQVELFSKAIFANFKLMQALDDEELYLQYFKARHQLIAARLRLNQSNEDIVLIRQFLDEVEAFAARYPSLEASKLLVFSLSGYAAVHKTPDDLPLQRSLIQRAVDILKSMTTAHPEKDSLKGLYAEKLYHVGHIEACLELWQEAESHLSQSLNQFKHLYDVYQKEDPQARIRYSNCLAGYWENLFLRLGKTHEGHHLLKLASQIDLSLAVDFPDRPDHRMTSQDSTYRLGVLYEWFGDWNRAYDMLGDLVNLNERLIKLYPDVVYHHFRYAVFLGKQGELAYALGRQEAARQHLTMSIRKFEEMHLKNQLTPDYMLGYCRLLTEGPFQELRDIQRAHELSKQILEKMPKHAENWLNSGRCFYQNGQFTEAEHALLKAIATKVDNHSMMMANIYLALTYAKVGQWEKAQAAYAAADKFVAKYPKDVVMLRLRNEIQGMWK